METVSPLLTEFEAAKSLRMSARRLKQMANEGLVPHVALPDGDLRFDALDLRKWVESHKRGEVSEGSE